MSHPLDLIQFSGRRRVTPVRQSEAGECGLACLAMVASYHGLHVDLSTLRRRYPISLKGTTFATLVSIADELGFNSRALKVSLEMLGDLSLPAILHWDLNHFVVLTGIERSLRGRRYKLCDPARGEISLTEQELSRFYTGVALTLLPSERFERKKEQSPLLIYQLWTRVSGLSSAVCQVFILSAILEIFSLIAPFYLQISVDTAIPSFDSQFLTTLAIGFAGLAVINLAVATLRDIILLKLGSALTYQLVTNLFRQLIRLPMSYFEKRHTGDVISRFDSAQPISDMLSRGLVQAIIDGLMALMTLAFMFYYSPFLAGLSVTALSVYIAGRAGSFRMLRSTNLNLITAQAAEASTMIESVRGMAAIKLFAREGNRHHFWQHKRADVVNASIRVGRMKVWFDAANKGLLALENVLFVYLSVHMAIDGKFTVGMIFAFQAYKSQFLGAGMRLVEQWVDLRLLDVHLGRLADIALTPTEQETAPPGSTYKPGLRGDIEVRNLYFAYGRGEREVLRGVSFQIMAGESVALTGPSGCGKTTFMKLLLGFYPPDAGEILIDGERAEKFGLRRFRSQIGVVLQDDVLYAGSLAENIGFFDTELDMDRVIEVARLACVHDDIVAMPMGYESLVGDMGSALSGGQKQRVLLARALYPRPKILFLDEGTSHLDVRTEAAVNHSISRLGITRVMIAHRPDTIAMADRVIAFENGAVIEMTKSSADARARGLSGIPSLNLL